MKHMCLKSHWRGRSLPMSSRVSPSDAVRIAFAAGGPVEGVRFGLDRVRDLSDRFLLHAAVIEELVTTGSRATRPLTRVELGSIRSLLTTPESPDIGLDGLASAVAGAGAAERYVLAPGEAHFLTACRVGWTFGAMQLLRIHVRRFGTRGRFLAHQASEEFRHAFVLGVDEAEDWLCKQLGLSELRLDVTGTLPFLQDSTIGRERSERPVLDGRSAGLAAAVATVGAVLRLTISVDTACTGEVQPSGHLEWVAGAKEKLQAASDAGLTRILAPKGFDSGSLIVTEVTMLPAALLAAFGHEALQGAIADLAGRIQPGSLADAQRHRQQTLALRGRRILVSVVSTNDPSSKVNAGQAAGQVLPGAIVRCAEASLPDTVHLLFQAGEQVSREANVAPTMQRLREHPSAPDVRLHELGEGNPADYGVLSRLIPPIVHEILAGDSGYGLGPDDILFLNTTSGTKQQGRILEAELVRQRPDVVLLEAPAGGEVGQVFPVALYLDDEEAT